MNKKLMAVAVAGAFGAFGATAAFAQSSTVSLSGSLNYNYGYFDNGGSSNGAAAKVRTDSLSNQESEWVMKGEEALGGGMAAFFQCSTSMDITGGAAANICGRTSYIGLKSASVGSISFGNHDTPAKRVAANYDPFPISAAMGQGGQMWNATAGNTGNGGVASGAATSFSRRQQNLITYDMPTMNGFDGSFAYSSANEASANNSGSTIQKPRMWSTFANYTNGPLALGVAYERHVDYNPGAAAKGKAGALVAAPFTVAGSLGTVDVLGGNYAGSNDSMYSLMAAYTFMGSLKISGIYNRMNYNGITTPAANSGYDMTVATYGVYADWAISGPHSVKLGYASQGATKGSFVGTVGSFVGNAGAGNTGSQKIHGEYNYALSKRTVVGLAYARMNNDALSAISIGTGANGTPNAGESQSFAGMLIRHKF